MWSLKFVLLAFGLSLLLERILEKLGKVDSIGLWYTAIVAAVYTLIVMVLGLVLQGVWAFLRNRGAEAERLRGQSDVSRGRDSTK